MENKCPKQDVYLTPSLEDSGKSKYKITPKCDWCGKFTKKFTYVASWLEPTDIELVCGKCRSKSGERHND